MRFILPWQVEVFVPLLNRFVKAKIDTGAENSSLYLPGHVLDTIEITKTVKISNSNGVRGGVPQVIIPITMPQPIGIRQVKVNVADRELLKFEMILGRSALTNILVDVGSCSD